MAKRSQSGYRSVLKGLLGFLIFVGMGLLLYLLVVIFGVLLPASDPNLVNIQSYIDWSHESFDFILESLPGFVLFASLIAGASAVTFLALKSNKK